MRFWRMHKPRNPLLRNNLMNKKFLLIIYILVISFFPTGCEVEESADSPSDVEIFLLEINPDLYRATFKMKNELDWVDQKIQKLYNLLEYFPDQRQTIKPKIRRWQKLRWDLDETLNKIDTQTETAYVTYQLDEILGRKKFDVISKELLKEAQTVLANAETTKSLLEKEEKIDDEK
jgi:conjugal transfer/entry exclusion protein